MEYPGTRFTRRLRYLTLIFFIVAFLIIAPVIILYTAGYRYDWEYGFLKETGSISIDIEPRNSSVHLNNIRLKDKMPIRLNNIAPGKYTIKITADGYYDWVKDIDVRNKQTVYIKEIQLLQKTKLALMAPTTGTVTTLALSHNGEFIAYLVTTQQQQQLFLWDVKKNRTLLVLTHASTEPLAIHWAERNNFFSVTDAARPHTLALTVNARNPLAYQNLGKELGIIEKLQWSSLEEPRLYYQTPAGIMAYLPLTGQKRLVTTERFLDWHMENDQLWVLAVNSSTRQQVITKDTLGFASTFATLEQETNQPAEHWHLANARANTVLLAHQQQNTYKLATRSETFIVTANNHRISPYNDWWLLWSPWELITYSATEEPYLLTRSGDYLQTVVPLDEYNTLALVWKDSVTALFPYYLVSHELLDEDISAVAADTKKRHLYFAGVVKGKSGIWQLAY